MLTCSSSSPKTPSIPQNFHFTPQKIKPTMDSSSSSSSTTTTTNRPSPRSLQGPRPAPLKVRKDSYKINKKPPADPNDYSQPPPQPQPQQPQPPRPPVIIYTVSPKIIHTNPDDFMTLVQRLTGPNSGDPSASAPSPAAALSPAARFAAIETADKASPRNNYKAGGIGGGDSIIMDDIMNTAEEGSGMLLDRPSSIPGILSPVPSSLQPISSSFFSPIASFDPGSLSFLNDLSSPGPGFGGGDGGSNFLVSPSNFLSTPTLPSPGPYWDLFGDL